MTVDHGQMSVKRTRAVQRYVNSLLPKLGLEGWVVDVFEEYLEPEGAAMATVLKHFCRKSAAVWFREDFFDAPPEFQRHVVVHELLHCVHAAPEAFIFEVLENHLPAKIHALVSDTYRQHHEYAIDGLAVALAPLFPAPPRL